MSEEAREDIFPEPTSRQEGPPHSWLGIGLGFTGLLFLTVATLLLAAQFERNRPMDLRAASLEVGDTVADLLHMHQVPADNILVSRPKLQKTASAYFYHFEYNVLLPETLSLGGMAKLIERDLLPRGVLTSEEDSGANLRVLDLSVGDFAFATVTLSRSPVPPIEAEGPLALRAELPATTQVPPSQDPPSTTARDMGRDLKTTPPPQRPGTFAAAPPVPAPKESKPQNIPARPAPMAPPAQAGSGSRKAPTTWKVAQARPRVAIIVDDGGYGGVATDVILGLTTRLTVAVLPNTPFGTELAAEAAALGFEVILHMPMENMSGDLVHEGQIETDMKETDIRRLMTHALSQVPEAVGINNHMGSKFTAHADVLSYFMGGVRERGLYFIDSRTTTDSRAYEVAREYGVPSAYRDIFLDHDNDLQKIRTRFNELMELARRDGSALGICHFRPNTASILREKLPELRLAGIELVHASELVR